MTPAELQAEIQAEQNVVIDDALRWIGTPFRHAMRERGVGVDCANLLLAAFHSVLGDVPVKPYPADWFLNSHDERLLDIIRAYCVEVDTPDYGDILTYRFGRAASHAGIVVDMDPLKIVHAYRPTKAVRLDEAGVGSALASRFDSAWRLSRWMPV